MKILNVKLLRGPNYWSGYRDKLVQMKLDIGDYEDWPTDRIEGFAERLEAALPSLYEHRCSEGVPGGFFHRVRTGTWLGHVVEHVALELQTLAGMTCGYGRTRSTGKRSVYHVVFAYELEDAGVYAAEAAVRIVEAIALNSGVDIDADIQVLSGIMAEKGLGPSTRAIYDEAKRRKIPVRRLNDESELWLGYGCNAHKVCAAMTDNSCAIAVELASDKEQTKAVLAAGKIPVPKGVCIREEAELREAVEAVGFPLVVKPACGNHGRGVVTNITSYEQALDAFIKARPICNDIVLERFITGGDYRLLVINYKFVAGAQRIPATVTGDGRSSISMLIDQLNADPRRGNGHENFLTKVEMDANTLQMLGRAGLSAGSVPAKGVEVVLKNTANLSTGGTSHDITDEIHPDNIFMAERTARLIGLDICGIDIVADDLTQPINGKNGAVIEVNASPGLRMHLEPGEGKKRNVAAPIIDMLYNNSSSARIPLVAVTGTNGKTTTTRLIAFMAQLAGYQTGYTTTDGVFINEQQVDAGDCSGPSSARLVLSDRLVDFAVLECARGGIMRSGLGFDHCSTSIVTNVSADHLGLDDIHTLKDLANVKAVVAASTLDNGCAILNAEDDLVYAMSRDLDCRIALFSLDPDNERIKQHCNKGGLTATVKDGYFTIRKGNVQTRVAPVQDVPMTMNGRLEFMVANILPAILAAVNENISLPVIREALQRFRLSPEQAPGRMNLFEFEEFQVILDYAHNPGGFEMLKRFLAKSSSTFKTGIIAAAGDRRDEDIIQMGRCAAEMFDDLIIRHDKDGRGRTNEEITNLLKRGIREIRGTAACIVISNEQDAISFAVNHAVKDSLIVVCSDEIQSSISYLRELMTSQEMFGKKLMEQNY